MDFNSLVEVAGLVYKKDFIAACDGNISVREGDSIVITPSGRHKGFLKEDDLVVMDLDGKASKGKPSSESLMHLAVYRSCPEARAVVHAHPPTAIAWSIAHPEMKELPAQCLSELILAVGKVPVVPFAQPGSAAMGEHLMPFLPECKVMILSRHGSLSWGTSLEEAYLGTERLEHTAKTLMYAQLMGGLTELPKKEVELLYALREQIGDRVI